MACEFLNTANGTGCEAFQHITLECDSLLRPVNGMQVQVLAITKRASIAYLTKLFAPHAPMQAVASSTKIQ